MFLRSELKSDNKFDVDLDISLTKLARARESCCPFLIRVEAKSASCAFTLLCISFV